MSKPATVDDTRVTWVYFVSRDSKDGVLSDVCGLWFVKPTCVRRRPPLPSRAVWVATDERDPGYLGECSLDDIELWFRTTPGTDRELIRVEQYATPKMIAEAKARSKK